MKTFAFEEIGTILRIDGRPHVVVAASAEAVTLVDQTTTVAADHRLEDLYEQYEEGRLEHQAPARMKKDGSVEPAKPSVSLSAMTDKERREVFDRLAVIRHIEQVPRGTRSMMREEVDPYSGAVISRTVLEHELAKISRIRGLDDAVPRSTFYGWRAEYLKHGDPADLRPQYDRRGRKQYLDPGVRNIMLIVLKERVKLVRAGRAAGIELKTTPTKIRAEVEKRLPATCSAPSVATVMREIKDLTAYEQDVLKLGYKAADLNYRMAQAIDRPELPLDRVEYDETETCVVVVDDNLGVPIGIPNMSYFVDYITECPIGFYLGFEQSSDVSTMAALRHACSPKAYMKKTYPEIEGTIPGGVPRGAIFDRSLTAFGNTVQAVATDLVMDYRYGKAFAPNLKGAVENFHRILRDAAFEHLAGYKLPPQIRPDWYDPAKHAVIPFSRLVQITHKYVADRYLTTPDRALKLSPMQRWRDGLQHTRPHFLNTTRDLDLVFGILDHGNLDHRGVRWGNGFYRGEGMDEHRRMMGASVAVRVKVNKADIGHMYWEDYLGVWRKAFHSSYRYAAGKSLHLDKIVADFARRYFGSSEEQALVAAERTVVECAREALLRIQGVREAGRIMKALHLGTDTMSGLSDSEAPRTVVTVPDYTLASTVPAPALLPPPDSSVEQPEPSPDGAPDDPSPKRKPIARRSFPKEYVR